MIVDAHTHRYPDGVIADPVAFAQRTGEGKWLDMVCPSDRPSLQGWADRETMLADMDTAGVTRSVILGWYWEHSSTCMEANEWNRQWIRQDPDRLIGFLSLKPGIPCLIDYLEQAREDGFQGIGESHPWAQGFRMQDEEWMQAMQFASDAGWPVNFHVTDPGGKDYPGKTSTPMEDFLWLANQLPDLKIILAHAGALYPMDHPAPENFYFDLAACPLLYPAQTYQKLIRCAGAEKILWGTDYPLRIYPASASPPDFLSFLEEFKQSVQLEEDEMQAVLGENIIRLLA